MGSRFTLDRGCGGQVSGISEAARGRYSAHTEGFRGYRADAALWQSQERSRPIGPCHRCHDIEVIPDIECGGVVRDSGGGGLRMVT